MYKKDQVLIVDIVDMTDKGDGIGKIDNYTVFVDGGVVGDKLEVKLTKVKKNYAQAVLLNIIEKSDIRCEDSCDKSDCGGCQIGHIKYEEQLKIKTKIVKDCLDRIGKIKDYVLHETIGMENPYRYRNKAQFPVSFKNNESVIGFYKKKSHEIVPCYQCKIQHEINDRVVKIVKEWLDEFNIRIYDEKKHKGIVRHIVTKYGFYTDELMVIIVTNGKKLPYYDILLNRLKKIKELKTVVHNINSDKTNRILGFENVNLYGNGIIRDYIGDLIFEISPLSFFQVNPVQTKKLYDKALEYANLSKDEDVFDIYCGLGSISLFLARASKHVIGVEIVEEAIKAAKKNAKLNNITNVDFYAGKAEDVFLKLHDEGNKASTVVVDPPRKGCDESVINCILDMKPNKVVYVSCNPSTLARDLSLLEQGGYKVQEVQPVDMFPHSMHVETVVGLRRNNC